MMSLGRMAVHRMTLNQPEKRENWFKQKRTEATEDSATNSNIQNEMIVFGTTMA
jgi:hypothetical protein